MSLLAFLWNTLEFCVFMRCNKILWENHSFVAPTERRSFSMVSIFTESTLGSTLIMMAGHSDVIGLRVL